MPIAGIVEMFLRKELEPKEEEGGYTLDPRKIFGVGKLNQVGASRGGPVILVSPILLKSCS